MKASAWWFGILAILGILFLAAPFLGTESLSIKEILIPDSPAHRIFFELRIPRACLVAVVGGALAILGGTYQTLFHNSLAEPYILGISSAVLLGSAVAELVFGFAPYSWGSQAGGWLVSFVATLLLVGLYLHRSGASTSRAMDRLVLFGMGLNFVLSSLLFLLVSYHAQQIGGGNWRWLFGQIPWVTESRALTFSLTVIPLLAVIILMSRSLDALSLGDSVARTLGFRPERVRTFLLVWTSLLLAFLVAATGSIGFVGLIIPHAVRLVFQPASARSTLLWSFGVGAIFLVAADVLSRCLMPPYEFPIGIMTTLLGGPALLYLLWKQGAR
jgi:iron complex transport system permease protein